jgi:hypothetical protein
MHIKAVRLYCIQTYAFIDSLLNSSRLYRLHSFIFYILVLGSSSYPELSIILREYILTESENHSPARAEVKKNNSMCLPQMHLRIP